MIARLFPCLAVFCAVVLGTACEKPKPTPPVVRVKPVEVVPYEEGYKTGFPRGEGAAIPKAALPKVDDVMALAREEAAQSADRDTKWERGFVEGYMDGYRKIALGQK